MPGHEHVADIWLDCSRHSGSVSPCLVPENPFDPQMLPEDFEKLLFLYRFWQEIVKSGRLSSLAVAIIDTSRGGNHDDFGQSLIRSNFSAERISVFPRHSNIADDSIKTMRAHNF